MADLRVGTKIRTVYSGEIYTIAGRAPEYDDYSNCWSGKAYNLFEGDWLNESQFTVEYGEGNNVTNITQEDRERFFRGFSPEPSLPLPHVNKKKVGFKRLNEHATVPTKAHATDSGFDLYASEDVVIEPGETAVVPTGIAVELPKGTEAQVRPRSGVTAKTKLRVQLGTIDNGYSGEIGVIVDNIETPSYYLDDGPPELYEDRTLLAKTLDGTFDKVSEVIPIKDGAYLIRKGDKLAQIVVQNLPQVEAVEVTELDVGERGSNGFGSTGV